MAGIYIHIPFCKSLCSYCDFYSCISLAEKDDILAAIGRELEQRRDFLPDKRIGTVYFGGGTPSLCEPSELGRLLDKISGLWDVSALEEITAEANPDDLTPAYLRALRAEGINRLSIGIQSFIDRDLRWMNRRHNAQTARRAVLEARQAGFHNLTVDLIYGIPGMTLSQWEYNLREAIRLEVPHLSAYHLTIEPGTVLGKRAAQGRFEEVDPELSRQQFALLRTMTREAGYEHYEVSNLALPGFRAVHNGNYWNGTPYLGAGPSAHSYNGHTRCWNPASNREYLARQSRGVPPEGEELTEEMKYNEFLMTALRTDRGVDSLELERKFGARKLYLFRDRIGRFVREGVVERHGTKYIVPADNYLVSDAIISDLFVV